VKINKTVEIPFVLDVYKYCTTECQSTLCRELIKDTKKDEIMEVEEKKESKDVTTKKLTGVYDLFGVLTHQGRTLQGGHYVAFIRQSADENDWLMFNDEKVSPKNAAAVKELAGAPDGHIAYLCFYRARFED